MADPRREGENSRTEGTNPEGSVPGGMEQPRRSESGRQSKTAGTNRDFDDSGESQNQGHGHPREERGES